jgi:hypothetical protein
VVHCVIVRPERAKRMDLFFCGYCAASSRSCPKREPGYEAAASRGLNETDNPWNDAVDAA